MYVSLSVSVMKQQGSCLRGEEDDEGILGGGECGGRQSLALLDVTEEVLVQLRMIVST